MYVDQYLILGILLATVGMFLWGRWRHDMVAAGALLACVMAGLVEPGDAFNGFAHPAVITVACVLVLSRGLQTSGAIDVLTRLMLPSKAGPMLAIATLTSLGAHPPGNRRPARSTHGRRTAHDLQLRSSYGINLLVVSRQGQRLMKRLRSHTFDAGDLLLLQGPPSAIARSAADVGGYRWRSAI